MSGFTIQVNDTIITADGTTNALKVYNCLVNIIRATKANTALGTSESEVTLHTNLQCTIKWKRGRERILFNKTTHDLDAIMRCRKVDITVNDRVVYQGKTYEIVDLYDYNNLGRLLVIALRKLE